MRAMGMKIPNGVGSSAHGLIRLVSNAELDAIEKAKDEAKQQAVEPLPLLVGHIKQCWEQARRAKDKVQKEILEDYRQRDSEYDPDKLAEIREHGGSEIFMPLTEMKCASFEAWVVDVVMPADDRAWELKTSPVVDVSPELQQRVVDEVVLEAEQAWMQGIAVDESALIERMSELMEEVKERTGELADEAAKRMSEKIEDDLVEGRWDEALPEAIYDFVTTKAGIVHGPILRRRERLRWKQGADGRFSPVMGLEIQKEYERVSPLDIYPSPDSKGIDDGFLFHHQRLSVSDLNAMIGVSGFNEKAIKDVISEYGDGGLRQWMWRDQERAKIEQKDFSALENAENRIDTLVFYGPVMGKWLAEQGVEDVVDTKEYEVTAWMVARHLIGVRLNADPEGKRPYAKASMEEFPGAFWGRGLARKIRHQQAMCNAAGRAVANDMGLTSMFQAAINDISRIPPNEDVSSIFPGKIWQFLPDKMSTSNRPAIEFFQPKSNAEQLMRVYDKFSELVDELVPSYFNGNQNISGAGSTASGLSMLLTQANKFVRRAIGNLDRGIVNRTVTMTYLMEMLYNPDQSIKGDLKVIAKGAVALLVKEQQQLRRQEFLATTNNPTDLQIMGLKGRATVLRETAKSLDLPLDDVVPDSESIEAQASQGEVMMQVSSIVERIAVALGMSPETLMQMAAQAEQQGADGQPDGQAVDESGSPVGGQMARQFG